MAHGAFVAGWLLGIAARPEQRAVQLRREYGRGMSALEEDFEVDGLNVDVCRWMKVRSITTNLMRKYSALSST